MHCAEVARLLQTNAPASIEDAFQDFPAQIAAELTEYLAQRGSELAPMGAPVTLAYEQLRDFVLQGGKRVRPRFAWAGYLCALYDATSPHQAADPHQVFHAISALELVQACALIHDDIIDDSETRRGYPTIHRSIAQRHQHDAWQGNSDHFGESVAILAGDLAIIWADDMFRGSAIDSAALGRADSAWRGMRSEVIGGQLLDIFLEAQGLPHHDDELEELSALTTNVSRYKTAAYTIERPLHLGAALGGASPEHIAALRKYGEHIGVAFQLRDDLLGVFGDPTITGKPAGDDLREGKVTLLITTALQRCAQSSTPAHQKLGNFIRQGLGHVRTPEEIAALRQAIVKSGAIEVLETKIQEHVTAGLSYLKDLQLGAMYQVLERLAIQATARER